MIPFFDAYRSNCYQYAVLKMSSSQPKFKIQPGYISGAEYTSLTKSAIVKAVKADLNQYIGTVKVRDFYETTKNAVPPKGYRKVALVIAPGVDYHWYEQNSNGYWSRKRGWDSVSNKDAAGNIISNPQTCNRDYGTYQYTNSTGTLRTLSLNYSSFAGWFMVK